jgi:hypothetical protein
MGHGHSPSSVPEEQGKSEGIHFPCDDEMEAEACQQVQTLSHYFLATAIKCCVSLEEISVTLSTTYKNKRVCTLLHVLLVTSLEVISTGVIFPVAL